MLQIINQGGSVAVPGHFVFLGREDGTADGDSLEVRFDKGDSGRIRRTATFLDSPPCLLESEGTVIGELRLDTPTLPTGRLKLRDEHFSIASSGPWTLLNSGDIHIARLTPAWRDSQVKVGMLAEVALHEACDDWVLAAFVFAWLAGQASAKRDLSFIASLGFFM